MKYQQVIIDGTGTLQAVEQQLREPHSGEVRVKVNAAGISIGDLLLRLGASALQPLAPESQPPLLPGADIAGIVDAIGPDVTGLDYGQSVVALLPEASGGYSEYVYLPPERLLPVPDGLDPALVAALPLDYLTAYQLLFRAAELPSGSSVLVHHAAGSIGMALLQLATLENIRAFGVCAEHEYALVRASGGTPLDVQPRNFHQRILELTDGQGVDVVFDPFGGVQHLRRCYRALTDGGLLVVYGLLSAADFARWQYQAGVRSRSLAYLRYADLRPDNRKTRLFTLDRAANTTYRDDLGYLVDLLATGRISPHISARLSLSAAEAGHGLLAAGEVSGKVVLLP